MDARLLKLKLVRDLPYEEHLEAQKVIDKGADPALFYFWFNLFKVHYHPDIFSVDQVEKEARYFADRNPDFEDDIITWFNRYCEKIKSYANTHTTATS